MRIIRTTKKILIIIIILFASIYYILFLSTLVLHQNHYHHHYRSHKNNNINHKEEEQEQQQQQNLLWTSEWRKFRTMKNNSNSNNNINNNKNHSIVLSSSSSSSSSCNGDNTNTNTNTNTNNNIDTTTTNPIIVTESDTIMEQNGWLNSPIINEEYKIIFFIIPKNGCTVIKQLFRRMLGLKNWYIQNHNIPHNPNYNGLKYLYHYSINEINNILNNKSYSKVMLLRDPKERFLSAYLDKCFTRNGQHMTTCCKNIYKTNYYLFTTPYNNNTNNNDTITLFENRRKNNIQGGYGKEKYIKPKKPYFKQYELNHINNICITKLQKSIEIFFKLIHSCPNDYHWKQQHLIYDTKYINKFLSSTNTDWKIGTFHNKYYYIKEWLQQVNAWEKYGQTGWGYYKNESIFDIYTSSSTSTTTTTNNNNNNNNDTNLLSSSTTITTITSSSIVKHKTNSESKFNKFFLRKNNNFLERVETYYMSDYNTFPNYLHLYNRTNNNNNNRNNRNNKKQQQS